VSDPKSNWPPSPLALREVFDSAPAYTVGIEDEVMLLAPDTLELLPEAPAALELLGGDPRFKLELPASQIEIVPSNSERLLDVAADLLDARRELAARVQGLGRLGSAGLHPFSSGVGELNQLARYRQTLTEYGPVAGRQLVCALQVHVSVGDAERALAIYNSVRSYLPLVAALAANAPFLEGRDTGFASIRPQISELLPRQGVPPTMDSWEAYAETFRWGAASGAFPELAPWWWELRLHPSFGTLEFRVPDGQSSVADAAAVAALVQALVVHLGERHEHGEQLPVHRTWRIEENRWSAARHGVEGRMAQLDDGTPRPTRDLLGELLDELEPISAMMGSRPAFEQARRMVAVNGAIQQRRVAAEAGMPGVAEWLTERFLVGLAG
jgi:glutamate---cysteine ligase / carboxylate-amine ligase